MKRSSRQLPNRLVTKGMTVGAIVGKWKRLAVNVLWTMSLDCHCKKGEESKLEDLVNDFKRAGTSVSRVTISNSLNNGLKSCFPRKVPLLKSVNVQTCVKFTNSHLDDAEESCGQIEPFGLNTIHCVWKKKCHPMKTIPAVEHGVEAVKDKT